METEQLYVGDERICPRTNYENDGAAEKIRQTRELLDELAVRVAEELLKKTDLADWAKRAQKPAYTAPEVGADVAGSAAGALADAKAYADGTYMQATGYTDSEIAKLINGSQTTLETIKQLSDAMQENEDIVDALENAMGSKASEVEFQAHAANETVHVTESEKEGWNAAVEHGRSGHAPANAERNTIAGIKRNGSGLVPDRDRNVDITVPTKISQLENDVIKKIAFSGQYSDLTGAPTSLKNPQALSFSGAAAGNYDGSVAKSVHIPSGTNGLMATAAGTWLDAVQGKALKGLWDQHETKINKINSDLFNVNVDVGNLNSFLNNAIFPFRCVELRSSSASTLPDMLSEYCAKIKVNAVFMGQMQGAAGEYVVLGQWWEDGKTGYALVFNGMYITLAYRSYGSSEWIVNLFAN